MVAKLKITPVTSSNVEGYHYDAAGKALTIKFKTGKSYTYSDVPQAAVDELVGAPSFGVHVSRHIISKYRIAKTA